MGDHPTRQSLTDVIERGAAQAQHLLPYVQPHETILEYGGGIGRLGRAVAPHVHRLVSVDSRPLMMEYGRRISPDIEFRQHEDLADSEAFDGAYSVAVFPHLPLEQQRHALEYVHRRLKPGGWFLLDLKIRPRTPESSSNDFVGATTLEDFRPLYDSLFTAKRVALFNSGFLLTKKTADAAASTPHDGHYAVNDASIVFDVLEGEVVVVNLDNGSYYILQGTASTIWQMLAAGRSVPEIGGLLSRHYANDSALVDASIADFVTQLTQEALLVPASAAAHAATAGDERLLSHDGKPFDAPVMFRYTDMQALIQMDPIREYDETGWPRRHTPPPPRPA
jgi:SAM-dependent methyltransferase